MMRYARWNPEDWRLFWRPRSPFRPVVTVDFSQVTRRPLTQEEWERLSSQLTTGESVTITGYYTPTAAPDRLAQHVRERKN